jgi:Hemopexin
MIDYFFSGKEYIRVTRGVSGAGTKDAGYPAPISNWGWGSFGANGIDAALYSGSKCYFFSGKEYIRVTRDVSGAGTKDPDYPAPISNWGWKNFGANGIDAAMRCDDKCYFFSGTQYIRVTRGETGAGTIDAGFPKPISNWGWGDFGKHGIDAALYSGSKCYFFKDNQFIRVTRGKTGAGTVDPGYPKPISNWGWGSFGANGIKAAFYSGGNLATIPPDGLESYSNYLLSNCNHISGLSVLINIDEAMNGEIGFGFQLNAYSASYEDADGAQQYVIMLDSEGVLWGWVENWTFIGDIVVNYKLQITSFNTPGLPAGTSLRIDLENDSSDRITAANFKAFDKSGKSLGSVKITLKGLENDDGKIVTDADLAPITVFQLNIVGPYDSLTASISSGFGTIVCTANENMTARATLPSCVDDQYQTGEQANTAYGKMQAAPDTQLAQYFETTSGNFPPAIHHAKFLHGLKLPK